MGSGKIYLKDSVRAELSRAFLSIRFPVSAAMIFLLWFFNAMRFKESQDVLYTVIHTWGRSIVQLLLMVIAAFPYAAAYAEDEEHDLLRYCVLREGRVYYAVSKMAACFLSASLSILAGSNLFLAVESGRMPIVADNSIAAENYGEMIGFGFLLPFHPVLYMELQFIFDALIIGAFTCLALSISTLIRYSNGIFVLPFMIYFIFGDVLGNPALGDRANVVSYFVVFGSEKNWRMQLICACIITMVIVLMSGFILAGRVKKKI